MKINVLVLCLGLVACSTNAQRRNRPSISSQRGTGPSGEDILIIRAESENNGDGSYRFLWENSDGTLAEESGYLKPGGNEGIQVAQGSYQYYSPEGELIRLQYIADENGFRPQGDHLPTPPPVSPEIQRALDLIYSNNNNRQQGQGGSRGGGGGRSRY